MPLIELTTVIHAPVERCFDLARSIDLHKLSMMGTDEKAIAGVMTGLIGKGDHVTWRAKHLGLTHSLTSKITKFDYPYHFRDEMVEGIFDMICHDHIFKYAGNNTLMTDIFQFKSPAWILGYFFDKLFLTRYLRVILLRRNQVIKEFAESDRWKQILNAYI